ncbi:hypothetical protein HPB49_004673 [Dermacentor silvarum]|uniref:Uncharacterized protein n=1 Tax=Dermacentor silvarum TaxID=543639 RepID=A0ACB8C250_DERSI|nr:hypothetical protein HPB49_004673 [Dermacentor silvarum]
MELSRTLDINGFSNGPLKQLARLLTSSPIRDVAGPVVPVDCVPIDLHTTTVTLDRKTGVSCLRKQFSIMQASAVTIRKLQDGTYSEVVYDYHKHHPRKLVYVDLSQATILDGLDTQKKTSPSTTEEKTRIRPCPTNFVD